MARPARDRINQRLLDALRRAFVTVEPGPAGTVDLRGIASPAIVEKYRRVTGMLVQGMASYLGGYLRGVQDFRRMARLAILSAALQVGTTYVGGLLLGVAGGRPVPGQEFAEAGLGKICDAGEDVG